MKIEELIIDGFKSYAVRTVISNWDDQFNAITGLNGSGKSNILDAICFVLGITNMSTVRAQNLQDLIYKRGQAGITRASVTIVFNNRDPASSPIGFENHPQVSVTRQIIMGGTSKYLINGHRALQQNVQNLFQSVQLNINNPNFLIMQGRITKVLNMKATEILSMIEEASGTRMFEERKEKAFRTMQRKEAKVEEINTLLREEIEPRLTKLRTEKKTFLEYQHIYNDLERLSHLCTAYDYYKLSLKVEELTVQASQKHSHIAEMESSLQTSKQEVLILKEKIKKIEDERMRQMSVSSDRTLDSQLQTVNENITRISTSIELKNTALEEEHGNLQQIRGKAKELETLLRGKRKRLDEVLSVYEKRKDEHQSISKDFKSQEELISSLTTGLSTTEGHETGYSRKLHEARDTLNDFKAEKETSRLKLEGLNKQISLTKPKKAEATKRCDQLNREIDILQNHVEKLKMSLKNTNSDITGEDVLQQKLKQLGKDRGNLLNELDALKSKLAYMEFTYTDPTPNFDRSKVKGLVAQLLTLNEENYDKQTALEITAGGRLYNLIVETEKIGAQLLQKGNLKRRVTIIPLNKITSFVASAERVGAAKKISNNKAQLALELIGYDDELLPAMQYVFGSTLVCDTPESAKKVTFHPSVKLKSVTLDGDVYDPSGTLTGGSVNKSAGPLLQIQKLNSLQLKLQVVTSEYEKLETQLKDLKTQNANFHRLEQEIQLKQHELTLLIEQRETDSSFRLLSDYQQYKDDVKDLKQRLPELDRLILQSDQAIKKIERDMQEWKHNKGSKMAELEKEFNQYKHKLDEFTPILEKSENDYNGVKLECEQLEGELQNHQQSLVQGESTTSLIKTEIAELELSLVNEEHNRKKLTELIEIESAKFSGLNKEIDSLSTSMKTFESEINNGELTIQKLNHEFDRLEREKSVAITAINHLEKENDWIDGQKQHFGKQGTIFDFHSQNMRQCREQLHNLKPRFASMRKAINPKVMDMIDGVEKKEAKLRSMIKTIHRDKKKIQDTVKSIDRFKRSALEKTWREVNSSFGEIFDELLPGNSAELQPPENKEFTDGLEIHVKIGSIWKDSLAELSGGQRSLVALALIMSLLKYKPAPMYILDEIDAALDLSHTQNIGRLIKTKFKGSQFIIVSLKEGMFTNANRLFHVRFMDGSSVVQAR
ncbi:Structural maintenance of chromosomes protein [Schizosaccharomyces pombe]